jgi:hypothetical protein
MTRIETFIFSHYSREMAIVRPEWSKGWAYTEDGGAWTNEELMTQTFPELYGGGRAEWDFAVGVFNKYDPKRVFTNKLLNILFP